MRIIKHADDWTTVPPGEIALCGYDSTCSACGGDPVYKAGQVIMANLTARGFNRGWWSCAGPGTARHWERGAIKRRLDATGSAKP